MGAVLRLAHRPRLLPGPRTDHGVWSVRAEQAVQGLQEAAGEGSKIELWVTGTLSPLAREQIKNREIAVREHIDTRITFIE